MKWRLSAAKGYLFALFTTLVSTGIEAVIWRFIPPTPELFFYIAVILTTYLFGPKPGFLAVILSATAMLVGFLPAEHRLEDFIDLSLFCATSCLVVWLITKSQKENRRAEAAARRAKQAQTAAEEATAKQERILSLISHDLKGPLTAISLSAQQIRRFPDRVGPNVERIQRAVDKANRLVLSVLDIAQATSAGPEHMNLKQTSVPRLLEEASDTYGPLAETKNIHLKVNPIYAGQTLCDEDSIIRVLGNLLSNAIEYVPKGGNVHMTACEQDREVLFEVSDSGPGISDEDLPRLFDPFWKGKQKGTGLGLYIAKQLVEIHGGRIWATASPEGASFFFTLPKARPS